MKDQNSQKEKGLVAITFIVEMKLHNIISTDKILMTYMTEFPYIIKLHKTLCFITNYSGTAITRLPR